MDNKLLKCITVCFLLNSYALLGFSQQEQFLIGSVSDSTFYKYLNKQIWSGYYESCLIDINSDGINDLTFKTYQIGSGVAGYTEYTSLIPFDSTFIVTKHIIDSICGYMGGTFDNSYDLVRMFSEGDTINSNYTFSLNENYIAYLYGHWNWPTCTQDYRDYWIKASGYKYIGIKKIIKGQTYWGWIQIKVIGSGQIVIKDYAFSNAIIELNEPILFDRCSIFPNPVKGFLQINCANIKSFVVFNSIGDLLISDSNYHNNDFLINVSMLKKGLYILLVKTNSGEKRFKFIKD